MNVEKTLLSFVVKDTEYFIKTKLANINSSMFVQKSAVGIYNILGLFFGEYKRIPSKEEFVKYLDIIDMNVSEKKDILLVIEEIYAYDISGKDIDFLIDDFKVQISKLKFEDAIQSAYDLSQKGFTNKAFDELQSRLFHITQYKKESGKMIELKDKVDEFRETFGEYEDSFGVSSGFSDIDELTGGWKPGDLALIMSGTGEGKSTALMNFAYNGFLSGANVLFIQLETDEQLLTNRLASKATKIPSENIRMGKISDDDREKILDELDVWESSENKFFICDFNYNCTPEMIEAKIHEIQMFNPIDLVVVDYLGILSLPKSETVSNMYLNKSLIAEKLKSMARSYNVPILTAQQVTRDSTASKSKDKYGLFDIAMSFYITHHCDIVMSLKVINMDELEFVSEVETLLSFEKNRQGRKGSVVLLTDFAIMNMTQGSACDLI